MSQTDNPLTMKFEPRTIEHLGVRMYSTLPPALAELISNAYDADAEHVTVRLKEDDGDPQSIEVEDDGCGMTLDEINTQFLVIGRNRRDSGDVPSPRFGRKATGKKGLGKLALFGLAKTVEIRTRKDGVENGFRLVWDELVSTTGDYHPEWFVQNVPCDDGAGTTITLCKLKRRSSFDPNGLASSLSKIFIFDDSFHLEISPPSGASIPVTNELKYEEFSAQFSWALEDVKPESEFDSRFNTVSGKILSAEKPISPRSGMRGISLFSRGKLVNLPEFFSDSTSSHFYQYVTGFIVADFIDELSADVISTNRQSLDWDDPTIAGFREYLQAIVQKVNTEWRRKRTEEKEQEVTDATGIDTGKWISTMPAEIGKRMKSILDTLAKDESIETVGAVAKQLHSMIPEYPLLHWRHLHPKIRDRVKSFYENQQYGFAAQQGCLIYQEELRTMTGKTEDGRDLVNPIFVYKEGPPVKLPNIQINKLQNLSEVNIQEGQAHLSRGVVVGFRNPIQHAPMDTSVPAIFTELDCLNVLSLISYLFAKLDGATVNP